MKEVQMLRLLLAGRMGTAWWLSPNRQWWMEVSCNGYQMAWAACGATLYCSKRWLAVKVNNLLHLSANGCSCLKDQARIGGATAAMVAGLTREQIMSIGGWSSAAVDQYLRALESTRLKVYERMGL